MNRALAIVVALVALTGRCFGISQDARGGNMCSVLLTIRSQVELHDVQNPDAPFDPALGWSQLINGGYIQYEPRNVLADHGTAITVGRAPDPSAAWAWAPDATGDPVTVTVRARDPNGVVLDTDQDIYAAVERLDASGPSRFVGLAIFLLLVLGPPAIAGVVLARRGRGAAAGNLPGSASH